MKIDTIKMGMLLMGACLFFSCEKVAFDDEAVEETEQTEDGLVNVTLNVGTFDIKPFTTRADDLSSLFSTIMVVAYQESSDGLSKVKATTQKSSGSGTFGKVTLSLRTGSYKVLIVGHSSKGNPSQNNPNKVDFSNDNGFTDTFYYYGDLTVGTEKQSINVTLKRATSMLRFVLTGDRLENVKTVKFTYTGGSGAFDATTGYGCENSTQIVTFDYNATGTQTFELYTFLHSNTAKLTVKIAAYDNPNDDPVKTISFTDIVPMEYGKITEFTGDMFTYGNTFTITADGSWGDPEKYTF